MGNKQQTFKIQRGLKFQDEDRIVVPKAAAGGGVRVKPGHKSMQFAQM